MSMAHSEFKKKLYNSVFLFRDQIFDVCLISTTCIPYGQQMFHWCWTK